MPVIMILLSFYGPLPLGSIVLLLYVDDIIITGNDIAGISLLKVQSQDHFEMKVLILL